MGAGRVGVGGVGRAGRRAAARRARRGARRPPASAAGSRACPSDERSTCASERLRTMTPGAGRADELREGHARGPPRSSRGRRRVGLLLQVSIWERAARLTPEERARSSSDSPRALRRCRRFSATRRPSSAAPTSSPGLASGRLGLRASTGVLHFTETEGWYSESPPFCPCLRDHRSHRLPRRLASRSRGATCSPARARPPSRRAAGARTGPSASGT